MGVVGSGACEACRPEGLAVSAGGQVSLDVPWPGTYDPGIISRMFSER